MSNKKMNPKQGHWVLAKLGKKVLRPGGRKLTETMLQLLDINTQDRVVEFAPGLGFTAKKALQQEPKSYTGIELNEEASNSLRKSIHGSGRKIVQANAANTPLENGAVSKVYGEAMLTMQSDKTKTAIIAEAHRILKKGGRYGIHEMGLAEQTENPTRRQIYAEIAREINSPARPMCLSEWIKLLEEQGFKVIKTATSPMHLLEPKRILEDEGVGRTIKIILRLLTQTKLRKRVLSMRNVFKNYSTQLNAVCIVAEKI